MSKSAILENDTGGNLGDLPNKQYQKFFEKLKEIDTLEVSEWKVAHIIGYFCKKYKETYDVDYKFKFNSPAPSKCFEVFQVKKLSSMLTSDPTLLKEYIDWIYLNKVVKAKRRLASISFMVNEGVVNDYKINVLLAKDKDSTAKIDRSTFLPENIKSLFKNIGMDLSTYGDLAFLSQATNKSEKLLLVFEEMSKEGIDQNFLRRIV